MFLKYFLIVALFFISFPSAEAESQCSTLFLNFTLSGGHFVSSDPFYSKTELETLREYYDQTDNTFDTKKQKDEVIEDQSSYVRIRSLERLFFKINLQTGEVKFQEDLFSPLLSQTEVSPNHPKWSAIQLGFVSFQKFIENLGAQINLKENFQGDSVIEGRAHFIRYFFKPDRVGAGVPFHKDGVEYQSTVLLNAPESYKGAELELLNEKTGEYNVIQPHINRLNIFDGQRLWHQVSPINIVVGPKDLKDNFVIRDIMTLFLFSKNGSYTRDYKEKGPTDNEGPFKSKTDL